VKYAPDHFGKKGFRCPTGKGELKTINIGRLQELVDEMLRKGELKPGKNGKIEVDLGKLGFEKLLGGGKVSMPLVVKVSEVSEEAERKVSKAGGQVVKLGG
jgi:large subunit ribosomal protein L15